MKMNRLVMSLFAGVLVTATQCAWASSSASERAVMADSVSASGVYAGFGFGYAPVSGSSLVTATNGASIGGRVGYAFNHSISTELAFDGITFVKSGTADVGISVFSAAVLGYYPVREGVDAYAKLGYANANVGLNTQLNNVSKSKTGLTYGFGAEFGHGEKTSMRLGIDHYDLSAWSTLPISANNFSLSIDFRL